MCKIAHREHGTFWNRCFSPSLGQYNEDNNNHKIKETVVAEAHQIFSVWKMPAVKEWLHSMWK